MEAEKLEIKIGCCGFAKGMKDYHRKFQLVEVQHTFYQPPKLETIKKWRDYAPEDFEFTLKAWQLITHTPKSPTYRRAKIKIEKAKEDKYGSFKPTKEVFDAWEETLRICRVLKAKVVVFQCPASFKPIKENIANMKAFFSSIDRSGLKITWEPRGRWQAEIIMDLCRDLELIHCVDPFKDEPLTEKTAYFRLHGSPPGKKMYNYRYTKKDLKALKGKISGFEEVYCMFNNMFMHENALEFIKMIKD
ncbi:MAG: DUF72 domain-containing protein [Thermoplasmata archaeon]|nr:MAG: DUF72 domain-containing protein [Thermoplasmata archaeon]